MCPDTAGTKKGMLNDVRCNAATKKGAGTGKVRVSTNELQKERKALQSGGDRQAGRQAGKKQGCVLCHGAHLGE